MFSGFLLFMVVFDWRCWLVIRRWVWILVGLAVAVVMDLCGWLWLGDYGIFFFFFMGLWCSNAVVVVVVVVAAGDLWVVVGRWCSNSVVW